MTIIAHCINPDCSHPHDQNGDNTYCISCGTNIKLNNRYIPVKPLGSGGFARVYTVLDLQTNQEKVLKVLIETQAKALILFEQEAEVLSRLNHPGIPKYEAYFTINCHHPAPRVLPCLIMEKINGQTLQDILDHQYPHGCPENLVLQWLNEVLDILTLLHQNNIIHRDIKPANLMIRQETGKLVAIDFGGAKQISSPQSNSTRLYSVGYSPSEQVLGQEITPTADFYALGKTMIHLLTGKSPEDLENLSLGWRNLVNINPTLGELLTTMIAEYPEKRPQTVAQIQYQLRGDTYLQQTHLVNTINNTVNQTGNIVNEAQKTIGNLGLSLFVGLGTIITKTVETLFKVCWGVIAGFGQIVLAGFDTLWAILGAGIGAAIGTVFGFLFAYVLPFGKQLSELAEQQLLIDEVGLQFLLFIIGGVFTIWGITASRAFDQKTQPLLSLFTGILGYGIIGLMWENVLLKIPENTAYPLIGLISLGLGIFSLGIDLNYQRLLHSMIVALGTGLIFTTLIELNLLPVKFILELFTEKNMPAYVGLFTFLGINIAFWLGISYYAIIPFFRLIMGENQQK